MRIFTLVVFTTSVTFLARVHADDPPVAEKSVGVGNIDTEMAQWLVDLARHEGHLLGRGGSPRATSLHVIALLEAARQCDPSYPDTYQWLYDLYLRMGRGKPAHDVLTRYVQLAPNDETSRLRLLEVELENRQTAEQRVEFIKSELGRGSLTPFYESELRRRLAKYYFESRDNEAATREIEIALRLNHMNVAARELAYEMFKETEPALQRVEMALQLISVNPSQAGLIWDLAEFLDRLSLHKESQEWFNRAIDVHRLSNDKPIPADYWQKLAASYMASGDFEQARKAADAAIASDPAHPGARLLRASILKKLKDDDKASQDLNAVNAAAEKLGSEISAGKKQERAAEVAWYYAYHHPDKDKAMQFARIAMAQPKPDALAKMAYGYALRLNGQNDEAINVLKPLSSADQLAAVELARAMLDNGNKSGANTILKTAAALQYSGVAYEQIRELLAKQNEKAPTAPAQPKVVSALQRFPRDIFDFFKKPGAYLKSSLRFEPAIDPLDSINVTLRMENAAPFAITLGEGFMVRPLAAISASVTTQKKTYDFTNYLQVLVNSRPVLMPGDAVEKTFSIDVGPIREQLLANALEPANLEVRALIDPVYDKGELVAGLGTISIAQIEVSRQPLDIKEGGITALLENARDENPMARIRAAHSIAAILAAIKKGPLANRVPQDKLTAALTQLLKDPEWHVRGRSVAACDAVRLDMKITNAAAPSVNDENAIVKTLGVRLFAPKHGKGFIPVLEQLSKNDPSTCVRMMAASFLPEAATVQVDPGTSP